MSTPLGQILSAGRVLDNTRHEVRDGIFTAGFREPVGLYDGRGERSTWRARQFLFSTAAGVRARLAEEGKLLIWPTPEEGEYEHNTRDEFLRVEAGPGAHGFSFTTGNLIGCVTGAVDDYPFTLRVSSRFGDEFLKAIIAEADGFLELPDAGGQEQGGYEWLLVYLWLVKIRKAFRLGLPKAYETRTESLSQLRGRLDPVDYFLQGPRGRYRCTFREHSYDNPTTRLLARTLQHLDAHAFLRGAQALSQTFQVATGGRRTPLLELLAAPPVRNPYFADYNPVIDLSKQILRQQLANFGVKSEASAFFFDVSMLFEYFVRKLLKRAGAAFHPKSDRLTIATGLLEGCTRRRIIPDLVFGLDGDTFVFDVKYKSFDFHYGVDREDLFQLHTYVAHLSHQHPVAGCGFIYPIRASRWKERGLEASRGILSHTLLQGGRTIPFHVVFLQVPDQAAVPDGEWPAAFRDAFRRMTAEFREALLDRLRADAPRGLLV
jgi:hypothetical protein